MQAALAATNWPFLGWLSVQLAAVFGVVAGLLWALSKLVPGRWCRIVQPPEWAEAEAEWVYKLAVTTASPRGGGAPRVVQRRFADYKWLAGQLEPVCAELNLPLVLRQLPTTRGPWSLLYRLTASEAVDRGKQVSAAAAVRR